MELRLEKERLITLTVPVLKFSWYKKGKEIIVDEKMFDVKSIQQNTDGSITVSGLFDYEEKALHKKLADFLNNNKERSSSFAKYFSIQLFAPVQLLYDSLQFQVVRNYTTHLSSGFLHRSQEVNTPPPKII